MYSSRASLALTERTTQETLQLMNMTIDGWGAPRTITKEKMQMKHITAAKDPETDCVKEGKHGCGWKFVKNYLPDKTTLRILVHNQESWTRRLHSTASATLTTAYCPVKVLLEYTEALKDGIRTMKHRYGGCDGSWLGNPTLKSQKYREPTPIDELPLFREIVVRSALMYADCMLYRLG